MASSPALCSARMVLDHRCLGESSGFACTKSNTEEQVEPVLRISDKPGDHFKFDVDIGRVVWKFRFEFCSVGRTSAAWWQCVEDLDPKLHPLHSVEEVRKEWSLSATDGQVSVSFTPSSLATHAKRDPDSEDGRADKEGKTLRCAECNGVSVRPYARLAYCLNEQCGMFVEAARIMSKSISPRSL